MAVLDSFFPAGLLDTMGGLQQSAYDRTCSVQSFTETRLPGGQVTKTWANVTGAVDVPCSYHPLSTEEKARAGMDVATHVVDVRLDYLTVDDGGTDRVAVRAEDRLVMDDGEVLYVYGKPKDVQGGHRWLHVTARNEP